MTGTKPNNPPGSPDSKLIRGIRRWDLIALIINGIIGAGIFGLPSKLFALTGPYSLLAFLFCCVLVFLLILCMAEVSSRFSGTGGPYLYARRAFGPLLAFEMGWLMWLTRIVAFAAICNLLVIYAAYFFPALETAGPRAMAITGIVCFILLVNFLGVTNTALVSNILVIVKLIPLLLFVGIGIFFIEPGNFNFGKFPPVSAFSSSIIILIFAFSGFEVATVYAGEVKNPRVVFPMAFFTALFVVAIIYILIQVVCIGTLPQLASTEKPLAIAAGAFMGKFGGAFITLGALFSMMGTLNSTTLGCSRLPFALASENQIPKIFSATHKKFHTPYVSIMGSGLVIWVATIFYTFVQALTLTVIIKLITFSTISISLIIFRRKENVEPAKFKAPAGVLVSILALLICVWLVSTTSLENIIHVGVACIVGIGIYFGYKMVSGHKSHQPG